MAEKVNAYVQDDELVAEAEDAVDSGEYRNMSHLVEEAMEGLLR